MSLGHNTSIVRNGLVFYYDMANTQKSWKGAPTTNLIDVAENLLDAKWTKESGFGTVTANYGTAPDGTSTATRLQYSSGYFYRRSDTAPAITALTAGTTVTFSCWVKGTAQPGRGIGLWSYAVGGIVAASSQSINADSWTRVSVTYTIAVGATTFAIMLAGAPGNIFQGDIQVWKPQLEVQGFATPYVLGTRSSTQAIVDLTSNNTVTANSLTYASDNTFSFNGSSNLITFPENALMNTNTPTVEVWIKTNSISQNGFWFEKGQVNTSYSLFQEGTNIVWRTVNSGSPPYDSLYATTASYLSTSAWAHIVGTYTSGDKRIYINGVQVTSNAVTGTIATNANGCSVGVYGGFNGIRSYYYNGSIGNVKIYNRALTATEVRQNFEAARGRYGI